MATNHLFQEIDRLHRSLFSFLAAFLVKAFFDHVHRFDLNGAVFDSKDALVG